MKKITKSIILLTLVFLSTSIFAQNNININAEKVNGGIKITTSKNGKTSSKVYSAKDAKKYLEKFGDEIDFNLKDLGDNNYKFSYRINDDETETVEINLGEVFEDLEINSDALKDDFKDLIDEISSTVTYEETIDEDGNKVYARTTHLK